MVLHEDHKEDIQFDEPEAGFKGKREAFENNPIIRKTADFFLDRGVTADLMTLYRIPAGITAVGLHALGLKWLAVAGFTIHGFMDGLDGIIARRDPSQKTKEGARWDSVVDKDVIFMALGYFALVHYGDNPAFLIGSGASIATDLRSQAERGGMIESNREGYRATFNPESYRIDSNNEQKVKKDQASIYGKIKFVLQSIAVGGTMAFHEHEATPYVAGGTLGVAAILGWHGTNLRKRYAQAANEGMLDGSDVTAYLDRHK